MNILKSQTFISIGSVLEGRVEDADLAEEGGDQEGGAGGVGGGRQQVRHPGGHGEHRGGDEVEGDVFTVLAHQLYLEPHHGEPASVRPGPLDRVLSCEVADGEGVPDDLGRGVEHAVSVPGLVAEHDGGVPLVEAGDPQLAGGGVEGEVCVIYRTAEYHFCLQYVLDF